MLRSLYGGLLIIAIIGAVVFFSRTSLVVGPAAQTPAVVEFGGVSLRLDYATTPAARERGLAGRPSIPSDYGMLFVFPKDGYYGFWMKDMLVPLDMFWLDTQGHVIYIAQEVATSSYPNVFYPTAPARYVLETVAGFAEAHSIATGTPLELKNLPIVTK